MRFFSVFIASIFVASQIVSAIPECNTKRLAWLHASDRAKENPTPANLEAKEKAKTEHIKCNDLAYGKMEFGRADRRPLTIGLRKEKRRPKVKRKMKGRF
jgi:hypothetical protein